MLHIIKIQYPNNVTVQGQSIVKGRTEVAKKYGTQNAFHGWLKNNYLDNNDMMLAMSLMHLPENEWKVRIKDIGIKVQYTYEEFEEMFEHWAGETIKVIVGM